MANIQFPNPLPSKATEIPFNKFINDFTWQKFERLCQDLARAEYKIEEIRPYGTAGDEQEGIDIYAFDKFKEKYLTLQCKRVKNYTAAKIKSAVDIFLAGNFKSNSYRFILCCTDDLSKGKRQIELNKQEKRLAKLGIEFHKWDYIGINNLLRKHTEIVGDTFGPNWIKSFNGEEAFEEYMSSFKPKIERPEKIHYEPVQIYVPRTIVTLQEYNNRDFYYEREDLTIRSLIEDKQSTTKKFILLSQGGNGKSSEFSYLANYFTNINNSFFPIKIELRNVIEGEEIETMISRKCLNWRGIDDKDLLLLFDGLDEVSETEYQEFIRRINVFSDTHKNAFIIISSRTNYFNILNGENLFTEFEILLLRDLSQTEIETFLLEQLGSQKDNFDVAVKTNGFYELLYSPFYLVFLTSIFIENYSKGTFPKSKTDILYAAVEKQFEKSNAKFASIGINLLDNKSKIEKLLKLVAFSMTQLARNNLSLSELQNIVPNDLERKMLRYSLLDFIDEKFQFSHNLIQEYLTALCLKDIEFNSIKELVAFKPRYRKIKNKWLNPLSFLLSALPMENNKLKEIVDWIVEIEPEVLVNMEYNKFFSDFRFQIAKTIIEKYKLKGIHIPYYYFGDKDLARFVGHTKLLLKYCVEEIKNIDTPFETKLVCVRILHKYQNLFSMEREVEEILIQCILTNDKYPYLQEQAIIGIAQLGKLIDLESSFKILSESKNVTDITFRNGMYALIEELPFREQFIDFAFGGVSILNNNKGTSSMGEERPIENILLKSKSPSHVKKVILFLINNKELLKGSYGKRISFDKDFIKCLITNASLAYKNDEKIFDFVILLIESLSYNYFHDSYFQAVNPFFTNTRTNKQAFNFFFEKSKAEEKYEWIQIQKMLLFADINDLKRIYKGYQLSLVSNDYIFTCRNVLQQVKAGLHDWFYKYINKESKNKFIYNEASSFDWNKHRERQLIRNQELLLNKRIFLQEVKKVFIVNKKSELTKEELWDFNREFIRDEEKLNNTLIINLLRDWVDNWGKVSYSKITTKYTDKKRWELLIIHEIVRILNDNQTVNDKLKDFAITYIQKTISTISFKKSVTDLSDGGFTITNFSSWLNLFCRKLDIELTENQLLDILYTDHYSVNEYEDVHYKTRPSNYVIKKLPDKAVIKERVLNNLKIEKLSTPVLGSHFYLCKVLRITEGKTFLYKALHEERFSEYEKVKILDIYLYLGGEISDLLEVYFIYPQFDHWYWHLTDELIKEHSDIVCNQLKKILLDKLASKENKSSAAIKLLSRGRIEAIKYFYECIKKTKSSPFDYHFASRMINIKFPAKQAFRYLFKALLISFSYPLLSNKNSFHRLDEATYSLIFIIALQSDESYELAIKLYNQFIKENIVSFPNVKNVNYPMSALENQFYKNKEEKVTLKDIINTNRLIGLTA